MEGSEAPSAAPGPGESESPAGVVAQFYEALRRGDNTRIAGLLTDVARAETANSGLAIQSQASTSLEYAIGETDYVTEQLDGAHVMSLWSEPDGNGSLVSTQVVWVLRKQANGWKISGMATPVAEGQLPLLFNFENPEDMLQKKSYVESQMAATADANEGNSEPAYQASGGQGQAPGTEIR
jgi:hypothetical protein